MCIIYIDNKIFISTILILNICALNCEFVYFFFSSTGTLPTEGMYSIVVCRGDEGSEWGFLREGCAFGEIGFIC